MRYLSESTDFSARTPRWPKNFSEVETREALRQGVVLNGVVGMNIASEKFPVLSFPGAVTRSLDGGRDVLSNLLMSSAVLNSMEMVLWGWM